MNGRMDGQTDAWMMMHGWMGGEANRQMITREWVDEWVSGWTYG